MTYSSTNQDQVPLKFYPLSFSWAAIHPHPKGIIQFIGGAFFGTFPTVFYRHFLKTLFEEGYTVVVFPFRFTFNHWSVAVELLREQSMVRQALIERVQRLNYDIKPYLDERNYRWVGHSLGCKYILLLELLSGYEMLDGDYLTNDDKWSNTWQMIQPQLPSSNNQIENKIKKQFNKLEDTVKIVIEEWIRVKNNIKKMIKEENQENMNFKELFIRNEPSLLIAPDISDTDSAIPIEAIAKFIDRLGRGVQPTKEQTKLLIENSSLFSLTSILSFAKDMIAGNLANATGDSDVAWLVQTLKPRLQGVKELENTYHLEPHGYQNNNYIVDSPGFLIVWPTALTFAPFRPFSPPARAFFNEIRKPIVKPLSEREILENTVIALLQN